MSSQQIEEEADTWSLASEDDHPSRAEAPDTAPAMLPTAADEAIPSSPEPEKQDTLWWSEFLIEHGRQHRQKLGKQTTPISMASGCTGMWSEGWCTQAHMSIIHVFVFQGFPLKVEV